MMNIIYYLPQLLNGTLITLLLVTCALAIGITLSFIMTLCVISKYTFLKIPVNAIVFFIRGTPLLVQIFLIYYGSGQFDWIKNSFLWIALREPFGCAVIALAINTAAYSTVLLKGAIDAVPSGEVMACKALGMSPSLMLRRIILPRALRIVLPAYSNEVVILLKGTSLASTITILDLMGVTNQIIAETYATMEYLIVAGIIYLVLNALVIGGFKMIERKVAI